MRKLVIALSLLNFLSINFLIGQTDHDILINLSKNIENLNTTLNGKVDKISEKVDDLVKLNDPNRKTEVVGYMIFKKNRRLPVLDNTGNPVTKTDAEKKASNNQVKEKSILVDSVRITIKQNKAISVTLFYDNENIVSHVLNIDLAKFSEELFFVLANSKERIRLNDLVNYSEVINGATISQTVIVLGEEKNKIELTQIR